MARRCGAKHIFKSKCIKHRTVGTIFEVPMFKNGTPLWREAHLQGKHRMLGPILYVLMFKKWHATVAQSTFSTQNAQNTARSDQFWKFRSAKIARRCGEKYMCKSKCAKHHTLGPLFEVPMFKNGTPLGHEVHL